MRKLASLIILLFCAAGAFAQNPTAVTGTITDPNGIVYYPATVTATLTPSTTNPTVGGQPINPNPGTPYVVGPVATNPNGSFSMQLFANGDITPAATQWVVTVTASGSAQPAGLGQKTFSITATISGSSQSLTTALNAAAPALLPTSSAAATSVPFSGVTTGTNAVALHMGTGGSLNATGSGTIAATSAPFSGVSTGTNAVALHVGTGGTLDATGSGTIHATTSDAATLAAAATALASTPTKCSAGNYPLGVDTGGNAQNCTAAATGTTVTVCSGSQALGTSLIASGAAATTVTVTCTGLASTDNISLDFNGSPLAVTGYVPSASGILTIIKWPTADTINISVVNNTGGSITPGAITLNYRVTR